MFVKSINYYKANPVNTKRMFNTHAHKKHGAEYQVKQQTCETRNNRENIKHLLLHENIAEMQETNLL